MSCRGTYNRVCHVRVLTITDVCLTGLDGVLKVTDVWRAGILTTDVPVVEVCRVQMSVL